MIIARVILIILVIYLIYKIVFDTAPYGYEDEDGYHEGEK